MSQGQRGAMNRQDVVSRRTTWSRRVWQNDQLLGSRVFARPRPTPRRRRCSEAPRAVAFATVVFATGRGPAPVASYAKELAWSGCLQRRGRTVIRAEEKRIEARSSGKPREVWTEGCAPAGRLSRESSRVCGATTQRSVAVPRASSAAATAQNQTRNARTRPSAGARQALRQRRATPRNEAHCGKVPGAASSRDPATL